MFHIALIFAMGLFTNQTSICAGFFYVFVEQSNSQMISDALINFFDNPGEIFELHPLNHCNCRYRCVEVSRTIFIRWYLPVSPIRLNILN